MRIFPSWSSVMKAKGRNTAGLVTVRSSPHRAAIGPPVGTSRSPSWSTRSLNPAERMASMSMRGGQILTQVGECEVHADHRLRRSEIRHAVLHADPWLARATWLGPGDARLAGRGAGCT